MDAYRYMIVGNGLIGCAAARYLGQEREVSVLVGPDEPEDWTKHDGVFASHFDSGRITRTLDSQYLWGLLAARSIDRYAALEEHSGIAFAHMVGCLKAVPDTDWGRNYIEANAQVGKRLGTAFELLSKSDLQSLFPFFCFPNSTIGILERSTGGWIDPRKMKQAQNVMAEKNGVEIVRETVVKQERPPGGGVLAITDAGREIRAEKVLVAAGAFSNCFNLLSKKLRITVRAETLFWAKSISHMD